MNEKHSEHTLCALLRAMHPKDTHFFAASVRNSTGYAARTIRTADAIAMSLWPSRGLHLHGFEIKCARNDWMRELKDPAKAEDIASRCDFWWIVAPEGVVKLEEVPANWGWLAPGELPRKKGVGLVEMKAPVKLQPIAMDRQFLAGILRSAQEDAPHEKEIAKMRAEIERAEHQKYVDREVRAEEAKNEREGGELKRLNQRIAEFEAASGVNIHSYQLGRIGTAVEVIRTAGKSVMAERLKNQAAEMARAAEFMLEAANELTGIDVKAAEAT